MHIALYSPCWPPAGAANGIVSYVATVRDYFASQGHRVSVLSEGNLHLDDNEVVSLAPHMKQGGLDQVKRRISKRLDSWHGALPCVGRMLAAQVQAAHSIAPIDILEMEESFGWSDTVRRLSGIPVVTRLHGPHFLHPTADRSLRARINRTQRCNNEARAVRSSLTLTAPTQAILDSTCQAYRRVRGDDDFVIPNPVKITAEAERWRLSECDRNHILMVGRFDYRKGADTMLLAFDKVLDTHPSAYLTLVGPIGGIELVSGKVLSFEEFARKYLSPRATRRVKLTGPLNTDEIAQIRRKAFVSVVAARFETFSYALTEGLSAGSPMLSTAWPASNEIIADGKTGFLTPVANPSAMADRLRWLLDHPEEAAAVAANGQKHCATTFCVDSIGKRLIDCFEATIRRASI